MRKGKILLITFLCALLSGNSKNIDVAKSFVKFIIIIICRAASVRLVSTVWWFFTLIIISSYTANLATFLIAENRVKNIESVEDFRACGLPHQPECKAKFGAKKGGSTFKFFQVRTIK